MITKIKKQLVFAGTEEGIRLNRADFGVEIINGVFIINPFTYECKTIKHLIVFDKYKYLVSELDIIPEWTKYVCTIDDFRSAQIIRPIPKTNLRCELYNKKFVKP